MVDGSFDLTAVTFPADLDENGNVPSSALFRSVTIKACLAGKTDDASAFEIFIYKKDCTEAAYIDYTQQHKIAIFPQLEENANLITSSITENYSQVQVGFTSSNPEKCAIEFTP